MSGEENSSPESNIPTTGPKRKRIRDNHNELERIRRVHQKSHLDALRACLPYPDMDERASMVSIFIRSREYIAALEHRVAELQRIMGMPMDAPVVPAVPAVPGALSQSKLVQSPPSSPPGSYSRPQDAQPGSGDSVVMHGGISFFNYASAQAAQGAHPAAERNFSGSSPRKSLSPLAESAVLASSAFPPSAAAERVTFDAQQLFDMLIDQNSETIRHTRQNSNLFSHNTFDLGRRQSSLLLPVDDRSGSAYFFSKRDSLNSFINEIVPNIVTGEALSNEITCRKCSFGMNNQIMIDCDGCGKWFHIRCIGVDSNCIPAVWSCPTCCARQPQQ